MKKTVLLIAIAALAHVAMACTSLLVSARMSATGRPLMWKHRDTGAEDNFVERVERAAGRLGYVALYNGGDSALAEAWTGMNEAGFAIMNTASYNLMPDTAKYADQEGRLMTVALGKCRTVDDFAVLLDTIAKPMGVQANFGVMDANGGMAYFETDDYKYTRFDMADAPEGYILRTNHSLTGNDTDGYGYIRYQNALHILKPEIESACLSPWAFTEKASKSFWHSLLQKDFAADTAQWVIDQDFIPRNITSASIVIEGARSAAEAADMLMWVEIGYTPCSYAQPVTLDAVPDGLRGLQPGFKSRDCNDAVDRKRKAFPIRRGNGNKYIDMNYVKSVMPEMRNRSYDAYRKIYKDLVK